MRIAGIQKKSYWPNPWAWIERRHYASFLLLVKDYR